MLASFKKLWLQEPAAVLATVQTIIALAVAFGIDLSGTQVGAILAAIAAVGGLATRSQVSSSRALKQLAEAGIGPDTVWPDKDEPTDPPIADIGKRWNDSGTDKPLGPP